MALASPGGTDLVDSVSHPEPQRGAVSVFASSALYAQSAPSSSAARPTPIRLHNVRSYQRTLEPRRFPRRRQLSFSLEVNRPVAISSETARDAMNA